MTKEIIKKFDEAVLSGRATWWEMQLPSGKVLFGTAKADMLGYPESQFKKFQDFVDLVHPEDRDKAMKAMREHLAGEREIYDVLYRIKTKGGKYLTFYDCGKIVEKEGDQITAMGFVWRVDELSDIDEQTAEFKKMILSGKPALIDLIKNARSK